MRFFTLCIVTILLFGCHKKDKTFPELDSQLLTFGQSNLDYLDTLFVESNCWSRDEFGLKSVQFTIQDLNAKVWFQKSISFSNNTSAWNGLVAVPLNNRYMPSGEYYIKVILDDGTYQTNEILSFTFIECPIERTHLFFSNNTGNQQLENWIDSNSPTAWLLGDEINPELTDPFHQLIWARHNTSPFVSAFSPMGTIPEWQSATASLSSIVQMELDPQHLGAWVLSEDGGIELFNEKGIRIKNALEINTKKISLSGAYIALAQTPPGHPNQVVIKNKTTWGHHHTWVHGKNAIQIFSWSDFIGIVYLENNQYQIALFNMNNLLPINWHPLQLQNWLSAPLLLSTDDELWVSGDGQIKAFNTTGEIIHGPYNLSPTTWIKSKVDGGIWLVENSQVKQMNPNSGQIIWTSPLNNYSYVLEMTNK